MAILWLRNSTSFPIDPVVTCGSAAVLAVVALIIRVDLICGAVRVFLLIYCEFFYGSASTSSHFGRLFPTLWLRKKFGYNLHVHFLSQKAHISQWIDSTILSDSH